MSSLGSVNVAISVGEVRVDRGGGGVAKVEHSTFLGATPATVLSSTVWRGRKEAGEDASYPLFVRVPSRDIQQGRGGGAG